LADKRKNHPNAQRELVDIALLSDQSQET
jgi:hypothetical protein